MELRKARLIQEPDRGHTNLEEMLSEFSRGVGEYMFRRTVVNPVAVKEITLNAKELTQRMHPKTHTSEHYEPAFFSGGLMKRYLEALDHFANQSSEGYSISHAIFYLPNGAQRHNDKHPDLVSGPAIHCVKIGDSRLQDYFSIINELNRRKTHTFLIAQAMKEQPAHAVLINYLQNEGVDPLITDCFIRRVDAKDLMKEAKNVLEETYSRN